MLLVVRRTRYQGSDDALDSDDGINSSRGSSFRIEKSPGEEAAMAVLGESAKRGYK